MALVRRFSKEAEDFYRKFSLAYEDRTRLGFEDCYGYRWFRSPNVTPIEYYRRPIIQVTTPDKRAG